MVEQVVTPSVSSLPLPRFLAPSSATTEPSPIFTLSPFAAPFSIAAPLRSSLPHPVAAMTASETPVSACLSAQRSPVLSFSDFIYSPHTPLPSSLPRPDVRGPSHLPSWLAAIAAMETQSALPPSDLAAIRSHILDGVSLDFDPTPPPALVFRNSLSVRLHADAVAARLDDYRRIGAAHPLPLSCPVPSHVQPLHVVIKDGKKPRVCIDLSRNMNDFIPAMPLSYESIHTAVDLSWPGCWYAKIDLSDCFLSFPLHSDIVPLFSFHFADRYWRFTSMPFGLRPAPSICTQLLAPVSFALTQAGILHSRYLDDFFLISSSQAQSARDLHVACLIFALFGLVVNAGKTMLPTQRGTYLGVLIDSLACSLACTPERIHELLTLAASFRRKTAATKTQLQSLLGKLSFASQVLSGARPFLRSCIDLAHSLDSSASQQQKIPLTAAFHDDLRYWTKVMTTWNGIARWRDAPHPVVISTDASGEGFGVYIEQLPLDLQHTTKLLHSGVAGTWDAETQHRAPHIGYREFFAMLFAAHLLSPHLRNRTLHIHCDNESDVRIINRQATRSADILPLLRALYALAAQHNFTVRATHRPGVLNVVADHLSRPAKHSFAFGPSFPFPHPVSSVRLLDSSCLQLVPLDQALANNSLELSRFSLRSRSASTHASPTPAISNASSASARSSDAALSPLSPKPSSALLASTIVSNAN